MHTATPQIHTLSLHDALPISHEDVRSRRHKDAGVERTVILEGQAGQVTEFIAAAHVGASRSEEHTSELQSRRDLVCRLLLEKKKARRPSLSQSLSPSLHALGP